MFDIPSSIINCNYESQNLNNIHPATGVDEKDGKTYMVVRATKNLQPGDEVCDDYVTFDLPRWFEDLVSRRDLRSVRQLGVSLKNQE